MCLSKQVAHLDKTWKFLMNLNTSSGKLLIPVAQKNSSWEASRACNILNSQVQMHISSPYTGLANVD